MMAARTPAPSLHVIGQPGPDRAGVWSHLHFDVVETSLRDGIPVRIRPVRPGDAGLFREGFERLSERSRLLRFLSPVSRLADEQLRRLIEVDFVDHFAWVAVRADRPEEMMGVARWVRLEGDPKVAEAAITVIDAYQGRGLGTLMLALLGLAARAGGITMFRAYVLAENAPMRELLEELGAMTHADSPGILRVDVPLDVDHMPDTPAARVLRAAAARLDEVTG